MSRKCGDGVWSNSNTVCDSIGKASVFASITKTYLCNIRAVIFKVVKLKFDIFLIFAQNIDCGYTLDPPRRGGSNEYPQSMFWSKNKKNRYIPAYPSFTV